MHKMVWIVSNVSKLISSSTLKSLVVFAWFVTICLIRNQKNNQEC